MESPVQSPFEAENAALPDAAAVRQQLMTYLSDLKDSQRVEVAFPTNFEDVVRCMTRHDLENPESQGEAATARAPRRVWSREVLENGVSEALGKDLEAGRYAAVLAEEKSGVSAAQLMVGLAQIRRLDERLLRKTENARRLHGELEEVHDCAEESDEKLNRVLEDVRHTPGLHRQRIGKLKERERQESPVNAETPTSASLALQMGTSPTPRSDLSIPDSDLYADSPSVKRRTFITAPKSDGSLSGATTPSATTSARSRRRSSVASGSANFVRENAERVARRDGLSEEDAKRLELLLDEKDDVVAFPTDAKLQKRLQEIDEKLLTANFGAVSFSTTQRNVQMGSLGLAALRSRGVSLPPPLMNLSAAMPFVDEHSSAADEALPPRGDRESTKASASEKKPQDAEGASLLVAKEHGKKNLEELKRERARQNALRSLDRAIQLLRSAPTHKSGSDNGSQDSRSGLLRPVSADEIRVATSEAIQRLQITAEDDGETPSLAPQHRIRALAEPYLTDDHFAVVEAPSSRELPNVGTLLEESSTARNEIAKALADLEEESNVDETAASDPLDRGVGPDSLDRGTPAGHAVSAAWELKGGTTSQALSEDEEALQPATDATYEERVQRLEEHKGEPGLTIHERKWLRKSDRARRRRMHQIERDATIQVLEERIAEQLS